VISAICWVGIVVARADEPLMNSRGALLEVGAGEQRFDGELGDFADGCGNPLAADMTMNTAIHSLRRDANSRCDVLLAAARFLEKSLDVSGVHWG